MEIPLDSLLGETRFQGQPRELGHFAKNMRAPERRRSKE